MSQDTHPTVYTPVNEPRFFGWKPSPPDHRDIFYSAPLLLKAFLPAEVDLSANWSSSPWNPVWNQGSLGSCGPNTALADTVFAALRQQNLPNCPMPSRLFVYYTTRMLMGTVSYDSGVENRAMLKALAQYGWCDESMWPYNINRFREKPPQECFEQAKTRKVSQYLAVEQNLEDMKACLAGGDPFIFGFTVYNSIDQAEKTGLIPYPRRTDRVVGGHDVLVCGYSSINNTFKIRNSWGPSWGHGGFGYIPFEYAINPRLAADFWTIRHSALPDIVPPLPPDPPQPPTPPIPPEPLPSGKITLDVDWLARNARVSSVS
jgi:C1A family cysteine protease